MSQTVGIDLFFISFLEYLMFWEMYPDGGWNMNCRRQFFDAAKEWLSHLPRPLPHLYWTLLHRSNIEIVAYKVDFDESDLSFHVTSDEGEYFALNELRILVNDEILRTIAERKHKLPESLRVM